MFFGGFFLTVCGSLFLPTGPLLTDTMTFCQRGNIAADFTEKLWFGGGKEHFKNCDVVYIVNLFGKYYVHTSKFSNQKPNLSTFKATFSIYLDTLKLKSELWGLIFLISEFDSFYPIFSVPKCSN